jgi:hypothetical protein
MGLVCFVPRNHFVPRNDSPFFVIASKAKQSHRNDISTLNPEEPNIFVPKRSRFWPILWEIDWQCQTGHQRIIQMMFKRLSSFLA